MNIIGDVGGLFGPLLKLVEKLPKEDFLFVGDLTDRGPQSKEVIEWVRKNNHKCLHSNHADMMIHWYYGKQTMYDSDLWFYNGGDRTFKSYGGKSAMKEDVKWLESLPLYYETTDLFVSHAAWKPEISLEQACRVDDYRFLDDSILWNRVPPKKRNQFQVFGHNGTLHRYDDYAVCIDDSRQGNLTALHWPTKTITQVETSL